MKKPSEEEQKKSGPYRTGDLVIHDKFGEGVIIGIRGEVGMIFFASQKRMTNIMLAHKALRKK